MTTILLEMVVLMACGVFWGWASPAGISARQLRSVLTTVVYYLFLPALVLKVIWLAPLGLSSLHIALLAAFGVLTSLAITWFSMRLLSAPATVAGACLLAAAWPNATYLGLPLQGALFGELGRSTAIQYDLFACTPLLLTLGILFARYYGAVGQRTEFITIDANPGDVVPDKAIPGDQHDNVMIALLRVPPLWAAMLAIVLNITHVSMPEIVDGSLTLLGNAVVPLMLFSLGLSLRLDSLRWRSIPFLIPVVVTQLVLMPLLVWLLALMLGVQGMQLHAVVIEAALPSMVLGVVLCDQYGLDTEIYAAAVSLTMLLSLISLPLWYGFII